MIVLRKGLLMREWLDKQSKVVKAILLIIPMINWIVELILRIEGLVKKSTTNNIIGLVLSIFVGVILGWIDAVLVLTDNSYLLLD